MTHLPSSTSRHEKNLLPNPAFHVCVENLIDISAYLRNDLDAGMKQGKFQRPGNSSADERIDPQTCHAPCSSQKGIIN
jgi:hypothetical protein